MAKYINADALMDKMWQVCGEEDTEIEKGRVKWDSGLWLRYKVFEETIPKIPAADVRPNLNGKWIRRRYIARSGRKVDMVYCTECGEEYSYDAETGVKAEDYNFCPNCGAMMKGQPE